jgi:hypothetical protein
MFQSQSFPGPWYKMPWLTTIPVTVIHIWAQSPTSVIHVGYGSTNSTSHVENPHPTIANHVGGTTLITTSNINTTSPTSIHHVGDDSLDFSFHVDNMSPNVVNDARGIQKPRHLRRKPKFLWRTCEGDHLTRLFPATTGIPKAWGLPKGPSGFVAYVVSPHLVSPLIEMVVISSQSSPNLTPLSSVMCPLSLLSCILFNLELKKWLY